MAIVRPRLTDFHDILLPQAQADFANAVLEYVARKERSCGDCRNDPVFAQLPLSSAEGK